MEEARMDFSQNEVSPLRRYGGLGLVVLLHILVAYIVLAGLGRRMIDVVIKPVETKIIEEVKPPPPPDTPPPPPPPKMTAPPPPFIPPPEVVVQTPVAPTIQATTTIQPPPQQFRPTVDAPVVPGTSPVAAFVNLNGCKPEYPRASVLAEEEGTVRIRFEVGPDSQLLGAPTIVKSSGFKNLDRATANGLSRCKFKAGYKDGKPISTAFTFDYVWKLDE
jgi:protein TonB